MLNCVFTFYILTHFCSHVLYGCNIWGLTTEENLSKIEVLQKKCVRTLFQLVKDIHTYETKSATRHLHIPQIHTTSYGNKSLKYHCPTLWNATIKNNIAVDKNVNNNIHSDSIHNLHHFKRILKKHYLHSYSLC